ncbi:hypothetical protein Cgig2_004843 [Carnegiea gigantea]|uniref:Uncharacterized protein n=1 Tax=Carnegiea gigantea TaxID=171969 RepID=A0A9Q1KT05_9CARY|nr:hypothetical protein Cgig2_004843 [Carnegiea gigantea]
MAGAIVVAAAQWIDNLMIQEGATLFEVEDQVRGLQEDLESMQQYLHDADAKQEVGEIRALVNQIRELAYEAEDVIDTYIIRVEAKVEWSDRSWWPSRLIRSARFMYRVPHMYRIGKHMQVIQSRFKQVTDKFNTCGVIRIAESAECSRLSRDESYRRQRAPRTYPFDDNENEYVVGREKDMSELIEVLMGEGNDQKTYLSIVGMGGSGKTTLAKKLYNHPYTAGCFDRKAWVFISQEWSTRHVLSQVLRMVSGRTSNLRASVDELVEKLHHFLENKSYLVVLDDVWKIEALQEILPALPRGTSNRGSKIIITTRNRDVTRFQILEQKQHIHEPKPLTEEEAGQLFHKFTLSHRQTYNMKSFENLGKEMLEKCDGLPLAIVALCGILNAKDSIREWQQVKESVLASVMEHEDIQVNDFKFVSSLDMRQRRAALHSSVNLPTQASRLRSLVVLTRSSVSNSAYSSKESLELEVMHKNFKLLRLLNLWGIQTSDCTLPSGIGNLIHLRYLGIRASNIIELPKSIGNLRNLLTLDYRNVNSDGNKGIWLLPSTALASYLLNSYLGSELVCKSGSFPQLEELYLENFANLERWKIEEGSLLNLKKLEIVGCRKLRHFPMGLLFVTTLQQLEFLGVPSEFGRVARVYGWSQKKLRLPHNYEAIMQRCDSAVSLSSIGNLYKELTAGVFLNNKKQANVDDRLIDYYHPSVLFGYYWEWIETQESDGISITVGNVKEARCQSNCNFELRGTFETANLSLQVKYEVAFVVSIPETPGLQVTMHTSHSNNKPGRLLQDLHANFDPSLPEMKEHTLQSTPRGEWIRLPVRQFQVSNHIRYISFALHEVVPGMIVKGVTIEPLL